MDRGGSFDRVELLGAISFVTGWRENRDKNKPEWPAKSVEFGILAVFCNVFGGVEESDALSSP